MLNYFLTFLISMVPIVELRGAIPYGLLNGGNVVIVTIVSVLGNILPIPFLIIFGGKVLNWLAKFPKFGKPFRKILEIGEKKVSKMKSSARKALFWGLFIFVAIPLPGTGAWTGALIAITLGLKLRKSILPIVCGVVTAGAIILTVYYTAYGVFEMLVS